MAVKTPKTKQTGETREQTLLRTAIDQFKSAQLAYQSQRQAAREDLAFVAGNQYTTANPGTDDYRVTVNVLGPFLRHITAEARQANPSIRVVAVSSDSDVETADVIGGLIKHVEQKSNAEGVYQNALWYAAAGGEGYIFLDSEYCSEDSFDQDLVIKSCDNPEKVFLDPGHNEKDGSDAEWGFVVEDIDTATFERKFPDSETAGLIRNNSWNLLTLPNDWINKDSVRVAKYWYKDYEIETIYLIQDPLTLKTTTTTEKPGDDVILLKKRQSYKVTVRACLLTCCEVLEETVWPGKWIPIIKVTGETFAVGGQRVQQGAIRQAKSPQRLYNFFQSRQFEMIDQAPKNSFVITDKQMGNHADKWANANRVNYGALPYVKEEGSPPPFRVQGLDGQSFTGVSQAKSEAFEAVKLVFGLGDSSLGMPGNEISGVAIANRVEQSSRSTYQYFDHLLLSMKFLGRQIVDVLPVFYDTERTVRIVKPTSEEELVLINSMMNGNRYDLTVGYYDVIVTTGPAYASKRREAFDALNGIMQTVGPENGRLIGDLVAGQVDSPVAKMAAARLRAALPPEVLAADGDNNNDMAPKELVIKQQQQIAQMTKSLQMAELKMQELQVQNETLKDKSAVELTKLDTDEKLKMSQMTLDAEMARMEFQLKSAELELKRAQLALAEKELHLKSTMAMHEVNEGEKPVLPDINIPQVDHDTNLGGTLE